MRDCQVWVVDDDTSIGWVLEKALTRAGYQVTLFDSGEGALAAINQRTGPSPDVMLSDIRMDGMSGFELIERAREVTPTLPVIIMTAYGDLDSAVDAYRHGAFEYLTKPFDIDEMVSLVERAWRQSDARPVVLAPRDIIPRMLGDSAAMQEVFRVIGRLSSSEMTVLIRGESGTGKELVANAIYRNSPRAKQSLVAINTAAIPAELLESELFGHEKGAFTGAHSRHIGRFEQADGATLFLDEIGDMPAGLQTRLLRVLSEGRFYRVGGRQEIAVDVRVIAATNQKLEALVEQGLFRDDLFHRLNVISITTPPLRERREDLPILVDHFMARAATELKSESRQCAPAVLDALRRYHWPGNVRQLENLVKRMMVLSPSSTIQLEDLPAEVIGQPENSENWERLLGVLAADKLKLGEKRLIQTLGSRFEKRLIEVALQHTGGHKQQAAEMLGWGRNTLTRKLHQLDLENL